jgi:hypothetical protein
MRLAVSSLAAALFAAPACGLFFDERTEAGTGGSNAGGGGGCANRAGSDDHWLLTLQGATVIDVEAGPDGSVVIAGLAHPIEDAILPGITESRFFVGRLPADGCEPRFTDLGTAIDNTGSADRSWITLSDGATGGVSVAWGTGSSVCADSALDPGPTDGVCTTGAVSVRCTTDAGNVPRSVSVAGADASLVAFSHGGGELFCDQPVVDGEAPLFGSFLLDARTGELRRVGAALQVSLHGELPDLRMYGVCYGDMVLGSACVGYPQWGIFGVTLSSLAPPFPVASDLVVHNGLVSGYSLVHGTQGGSIAMSLAVDASVEPDYLLGYQGADQQGVLSPIGEDGQLVVIPRGVSDVPSGGLMLAGVANTSTGQGALSCPGGIASCLGYGFWAHASGGQIVASEAIRSVGAGGLCAGATAAGAYTRDGDVIVAGSYTCGELSVGELRGASAPETTPPVSAMFVMRRPL